MSQEDSVTKTIGEKEFTMYMLPPKDSNDLLVDVLTMIGPSLGPVFDTFFSALTSKGLEALMEMEIPPEFFTKVSVRLFSDLDKKTMNKVIAKFTGVTAVDGVLLEKVFDEVFRGKLDNMYRWLAWGLDVQWGKSLTALLQETGVALGGKLGAMASQSPTISTG